VLYETSAVRTLWDPARIVDAIAAIVADGPRTNGTSGERRPLSRRLHRRWRRAAASV